MKQAWRIGWDSLGEKKEIAEGGFGLVYSANWCDRTVAVKVMKHSNEDPETTSPEFEGECRALRQYRDSHLVLFFGVGCSPDKRQFIVTEFVERGSLRSVLDKEKDNLDWKIRLSMAVDIASGVDFLHRQTPPVIHRDLKSPNVLVTNSYRCKIGDLGTARLIEITRQLPREREQVKKSWFKSFKVTLRARRGTSSRSRAHIDASIHESVEVDAQKVSLLGKQSNSDFTDRVGTTKWAASEMLKRINYGLPVEIYATGIVLWEIATNSLPYPDEHWSHKIDEEVLDGKRPVWPEKHFAAHSAGYKSLAEACWEANPEDRPTAQEMLDIILAIV